MKVHFIAIGGSAMHNLAIALSKKGYTVTGSDDEIFEPAKSHLATYGLLPEAPGWNPDLITPDLDAVILGMHAFEDNPELQRARELNLRIYSYPEYLYEQTKNKTRVVIGGSHGKTTITAMIMHVLHFHHKKFDYMVGSQLEGFDAMVSLSEDAPVAVFEGDEYLASTLDPRPKFHLYKPDIALISGIAWDHINVFPTFDKYVEQFRIFAQLVPAKGAVVYFGQDENIRKVVNQVKEGVRKLPYDTHPHEIEKGTTYLLTPKGKVPLQIFGDHNLQNISGAKQVCNLIGINDQEFYQAISQFKGAAKRLQLLQEDKDTSIYLDFAHSPSKLLATIKAVKSQYPQRHLVACMELHTFSSLTKEFLPHYKGTMIEADQAFVYFNPQTIEHKHLQSITKEEVKEAFAGKNVTVFTDAQELQKTILQIDWRDKNLLLMSSGNFSGIDFKEFSKEIIKRTYCK
ncbi:MAG: Mur ligase family protein [Bacteroidota bacterium]|nr:Mur ligase family protein [Bacteroidota bacterium]